MIKFAAIVAFATFALIQTLDIEPSNAPSGNRAAASQLAQLDR